MAATIMCQAPGDPHPADVLLNRLDGSTAFALCDADYVAWIVQTVDAMREAEAEADRAAATAAADAEAAEADAIALSRLHEAEKRPRSRRDAEPDPSPGSSSDEAAAPDASPGGSSAGQLEAGPTDDDPDDEDEDPYAWSVDRPPCARDGCGHTGAHGGRQHLGKCGNCACPGYLLPDAVPIA